jgi:S1-C subfamily serine protease
MRTMCLLLCAGWLSAQDLSPDAAAIYKPLVRVSTANGSGSGVILYSEDREKNGEFRTFVLTNHHVVSSAIHVVRKWDSLRQRYYNTEANDRVKVEVFTYLRAGRTVIGRPIPAEIRAHKEEEDMALLELDYPLPIPKCAVLLPANLELSLLQPVWAVGCSLGEDPIATAGHIMDLEELIENKPYILASAQIIYGNSGGGVFAKIKGTIYFIGIPSRIRVMRNGQALSHMGFFVPPARIRRFFKLQQLDFLLDPDVTPAESFKARAKLQHREDLGPPPPSAD